MLIVLFVQLTFAQESRLSGKVTDAGGLPIPGANIIVKGTTTSAQTGFDGEFSIIAKKGQTLIVSFIGMKTTEVSASASMLIKLGDDSNELEAVVVVGFGTQSKKKLTDNIARVTAKDMENVPVANFQNAMVGKLAGVQITQINGKVEGGVKLRVRGVSSISSSQEPLYVIDGMPLINDNESGSAAPINQLISLNPNDIESVEILKDASSAAIYGARGTNGVVLITTKQGKSGKTKISLNTSAGWSEATHKMSWLNAAQYAELYTEASAYRYGAGDLWLTEPGGVFDGYANGKDWRTGQVDTDWQDLALVKGAVQDHTFSISGGDRKQYFFFLEVTITLKVLCEETIWIVTRIEEI